MTENEVKKQEPEETVDICEVMFHPVYKKRLMDEINKQKDSYKIYSKAKELTLIIHELCNGKPTLVCLLALMCQSEFVAYGELKEVM